MNVVVPELETDRLRLVGWRLDHFDGLATFYGDPLTSAPYDGPLDRIDAWKRLSAHAGHWQLLGFGHWAVEEKGSGAFVGFAGVWRPEGMPEPELSWGLLSAFHGYGYATEAADAAKSYAFAVLRMPTLASFIDADNRPSIRVAERLGARLDGVVDIHGWTPTVYRHHPNVAAEVGRVFGRDRSTVSPQPTSQRIHTD